MIFLLSSLATGGDRGSALDPAQTSCFIPFNKIPSTPLLACVMEILSASIFNYYQAFSCSVKPDTNYGSHDGRPQDCFAAGGVQS